MNFIDHALSEITKGEDFIQAMADIYEYPEVRDELDKYPSWIQNIIAIIDYDTELGMDGLDLKSYADVVKVLDEIGLVDEAEVLRDYNKDISEENANLCYEKLAINNDYDAFWSKVYAYADENMSDNRNYLK
ncbi:hypothetical protein [uncultured Catenibacterium sp.]|uniref:hypothetical protein n=1 Tax=uncultured Catenibacterium sp. TaxID=286142 RepID=UPI0025CB8A9C|nr:hypothetical protein [uncultured Catenibacterium sp.]